MKIDKLSAYLQASRPSNVRSEEGRKAQQERAVSDEAVRISPSLTAKGEDVAAREARVAEIKAQVQAGTYQMPDSKEVAKAFLKELAGVAG